MNKDEESKLLEIIEFIKQSDSYKKYLESKSLIENDKEIMNCIENIKKYQKELVKNKTSKNNLELKIKNCLDFLNTNPTYLEYLNYLDDINNMLNIFENKINKYFEDVFN